MGKKPQSKVWVPPDSAFLLPPRPLLQTLPLLPWDHFQRLCARLASRNGDVEFTQEYGLQGQDQEGIDIYVRRRSSNRYAVWQCKKYQEAQARLIRDAVDQFLAGEWAAKSDEFVLCISAQISERSIADEIERQRHQLAIKNITFTPLGIIQLSERLKDHPDLVHDFFGLSAVKDFCGEEAAVKLVDCKLTPEQVSKLRVLLRRCYAYHFESVDPGLPSLTSAIARAPAPLPLYERFVIPDVLEPRQFTQTQLVTAPATNSPTAGATGAEPELSAPSTAGRLVTVTSEMRTNALDWLVKGHLSVIIGDPGIGKSSLIRYALLDLLSAEPRHEQFAIKWGNRLPVWVPFAMWTRMVTESETGSSLADLLDGWLSKVSAPPELKTLVQEALDDSRLLLFIDGLDEWSDEVAAGTTVALLEQFVGERGVPAIATTLRQDLEVCIRRWYPDRFGYRSGVYAAMALWPRDPAVIEVLWRGLVNGKEADQRTAAEAIAQAFGGDNSMRERLLELIVTPISPRTTAYALHSLCKGWPAETKLQGFLNHGRSSSEPLVRVVSSCNRVNRREHDQRDREMLLQFANDRPFSTYHWKSDGVQALLTGWPHDPEIKRKALKAISALARWQAPMSPEAAGQILLDGYPQDDEVARALVQLFQTEDYPQHIFGLESTNWEHLVKSFSGHVLLGGAVDDWLERKGNRFWDCQLCLISKSERARAYLCKPDEKTGVINQHQAQFLIDGWGMGDPIAARALQDIVESDQAKQVLHLLPAIMADKESCRRYLMGYLRHESEYFVHLALMGLISLGANPQDSEIVETVIAKYAGCVPNGISFIGIDDLIYWAPESSSVRQLAIHQVNNRGGAIGMVARAYGKDHEMQRLILAQMSPLPSNLRLRLVERLARLAPEDDFAHKLLDNFDQDAGNRVKIAGAIGFAGSVQQRGISAIRLIDRLCDELKAIGPDHAERRQAAFAGLLELDRMDVAVIASKQDAPKNMSLSGVGRMNLRLASHLAMHWDRVKTAFGETFWNHVGYVPNEFIEEMASQTSDDDLIESLLGKLKVNTGQTMSLVELRIRSKQWRGTSKLRQVCLNLVRNFGPSDWNHCAPGILAAEILSEQYAQDTEVHNKLTDKTGEVHNASALVVALCAGWPSSDVLIQIREGAEQRLMTPAQVHLFCRFTPPSAFVNALGSVLSKLTGEIWDFLPTCTRALEARFKRDSEAREKALARLEADPTPTEKCNVAQLLRRTDSQLDRLRKWARAELNRQHKRQLLPDSALDIFTGQIRTIADVLMDLVSN